MRRTACNRSWRLSKSRQTNPTSVWTNCTNWNNTNAANNSVSNSSKYCILISQNELEVEERQVKKLIGEITHQKLEAQKIIEEQEELKQLQNMQRKSVTGDSINLQKDKKKAN